MYFHILPVKNYLLSYSLSSTVNTEQSRVEASKHFLVMFLTGIAIMSCSQVTETKSLAKRSCIHTISEETLFSGRVHSAQLQKV